MRYEFYHKKFCIKLSLSFCVGFPVHVKKLSTSQELTPFHDQLQILVEKSKGSKIRPCMVDRRLRGYLQATR